MTKRRVFSAVDAHPTVLYAKREAESQDAYPILSDNGKLSAELKDLATQLRGVIDALQFPSSMDMASYRQRVTAIIESGTVVTSSTLNLVNGYQPQDMVLGPNLTAWALCCRERIS